MVDVTVTRAIGAPPERVAEVMFDPARDPEWIGGAKSAEFLDGATGLAPGVRVRRAGGFLGRRFEWVTEVVEYAPARLARMRHVSGPFTGEVVYAIEPRGEGAAVSVRNVGRAAFEAPGMGWLMRAAVGKDLERLKALVEGT